MNMVQVKVSDGPRSMVTWIENRKGVKKGCRITLKNSHTLWHVDEVYGIMDDGNIHDDWNVGGLIKRPHL